MSRFPGAADAGGRSCNADVAASWTRAARRCRPDAKTLSGEPPAAAAASGSSASGRAARCWPSRAGSAEVHVSIRADLATESAEQ